MIDENWDRVIDMEATTIITQTKDLLIVQTEDLADTMFVLQNAWWKLLDMIEDDYWIYGCRCERMLLYYGKGDRFNSLFE